VKRLFLSCLALMFTLAPAVAEDAAAGHLTLDLNALQPAANACRVTFLATNGLAAPLDKATFELAVFGADGAIVRVVSADFRGLTAGKTKVLQFDLKDLVCDGISRLLVNDVTACEGPGVAPGACLAGLETTTRTKVAFGQ